NGEKVKVAAHRLSSFIEKPVDLLKVDIEGAETIVLPELAKSGKLSLVKKMHLEYHHHISGSLDQLSSVLKLLEEFGFGYQIQSSPDPWGIERTFQDISIYCYQKAEN